MSTPYTVILPFSSGSASTALRFVQELPREVEALLVGSGPLAAPALPNVSVISAEPGKGAALRAALPRVKREVVVVQDPDAAYSSSSWAELVRPIAEDSADAVFGCRQLRGVGPDQALNRLAGFVTDLPLRDPLSGQRAFRTAALRSIQLSGDDDSVDAELVVKLAAQRYRLTEIPVPLSGATGGALDSRLARLRTLLRYASVQNDADNQHEGYNTLSRLEGAPNYNRWIAQNFAPHLGSRVLEIGAGIGTITEEIEANRELLIALEVDPFYVARLKNRFRGKPHVRPYLSDVALADWESLRSERLDSIVLSNVLEHIPDDASAARRFSDILEPGGRLIVLVPALPALFGAIDEAVGHHRRYTRETLLRVLEGAGFEIERLDWLNLAGVPGWFLNSRLLRRRTVPALQLRIYDRLAPLLARAESHVRLPVGMSLFAVARKPSHSARVERTG